MKVVCVWSSTSSKSAYLTQGLSVGKSYEVVKVIQFTTAENTYKIINDFGDPWYYNSIYFEKLEDQRDRKLEELLYGSDM